MLMFFFKCPDINPTDSYHISALTVKQLSELKVFVFNITEDIVRNLGKTCSVHVSTSLCSDHCMKNKQIPNQA